MDDEFEYKSFNLIQRIEARLVGMFGKVLGHFSYMLVVLFPFSLLGYLGVVLNEKFPAEKVPTMAIVFACSYVGAAMIFTIDKYMNAVTPEAISGLYEGKYLWYRVGIGPFRTQAQAVVLETPVLGSVSCRVQLLHRGFKRFPLSKHFPGETLFAGPFELFWR